MSSKASELVDLSQFAVGVVRHAGEEALARYGRGNPRMKFDEELVTQAELELTKFFEKKLMTHYPEHQIFPNGGENEGYTHEKKRYLWVYDALDGVANFQAGIPIWGISLALLENFWPVLGVFYMPATGDLFHAQAGKQALWGDSRIRTSSQAIIDDESLLLTFSRFHQHYRSTFPGKIRSLGCTAAHICYVAMGRADGALLTNQAYPDLAAARVIIESAGGKIFKMDGEEFFLNEYLHGQRIDDHLVVADPGNVSGIRNCIHRI